jgi:hypothetical protein
MSEEPKSVVYYELRDTITQLRRENEILKQALYHCQTGMGDGGNKAEDYEGLDEHDLREDIASRVRVARAALKDCEELK